MKTLIISLALIIALTNCDFAFGSVPAKDITIATQELKQNNHSTITNTKHEKQSFFQKVWHKLFFKKYRADSDPDRKASTSFVCGFLGFISLVAVFANPFIALASIPLSIAAIIIGNQALKEGTNKESTAKAGKTFGIVNLVLIAVGTVVGLIAISSMRFM